MITRSEVELERELDITRVLRGVDQTHRRASHARVWSIQVNVIESVYEVRPELELHSFGNVEVLLQA